MVSSLALWQAQGLNPAHVSCLYLCNILAIKTYMLNFVGSICFIFTDYKISSC